MSQTSFIESPIYNLTDTQTILHPAFASDVPTTLALAESLGLFHREFGFGIREIDHATALWERSKGLDSHLVGLSWVEGTYPVVALTGSKVRSIMDLKGKRLGIVKITDIPFDVGYAQQLKVYTTVLSTAKLTLADVELVPIQRSKSVPALSRGSGFKQKATVELNAELAARLHQGEFDAIAVALASDIAEHTSVRILSDTQDHYDFIARVNPDVLRALVVSGASLREHRDGIVQVLARFLQAADWARTRTVEQIAAQLAETIGVDPEALASKYGGLVQGVQVDFSVEKVLGLRSQKNFLLRHGLIQKNFDLDQWIDQRPFAEARQLHAESEPVW
jgi:sulfonate transport system substrate-binding protein